MRCILRSFLQHFRSPGMNARNAVVNCAGDIERDPCGSGTHAKLSVLYDHKQIGLLRKLYEEDKYFSRLCCNLYRGDLFCGTNWFYEHMKNPKMKQRYMPEVEEADIDYLKLNNIFLEHAKRAIKLSSAHMNWIVSAKLYIITCRNRLWFKLNHIYKRNFRNLQYLLGCVINKGLTYIVNIIT